ncbi:unnamed protein product [Phytophthora fragariaefolia]|uniref:Unnamed protein product n=1 Tax=Phytophthora fragariaefolia TaxID=1490495 RepID=A0A9W6TM82_9STRA|nr:unnamed protein product [Phytophthora fragariaefolia]
MRRQNAFQTQNPHRSTNDERAPSHAGSDDVDEVPSHTEAPPQDGETPDAGTGRSGVASDVELGLLNDPAATAVAFAAVDQLLVTQQVISEATAKFIFQGDLNLAQSAFAAASHPTLPGDVPSAHFEVHQDPPSFVVGVPATNKDRLTEHFMRDGYGGLETLVFVETISDEDMQDLTGIINPKLSMRPELLLPRSVEPSATVPEFRDLLSSLDARRELTLAQLRETKRHLRSSGSWDSAELLKKITEIDSMKTGFAFLNQHWKEAFLVSKRQLDQEVADHTRDFKRASQIPEQEEEALRSRLMVVTRERDDVFAYARSLKDQLKAGSLDIPQVMNFLNQYQTRVVGNWSRLKSLLEHLKDHKTPPSDWITQIMVNAIDDYSAQPGPFVALDEENADEACSGATHSGNLHISATRTNGYIRVGHIAAWSPFIVGRNTIGRKQ